MTRTLMSVAVAGAILAGGACAQAQQPEEAFRLAAERLTGDTTAKLAFDGRVEMSSTMPGLDLGDLTESLTEGFAVPSPDLSNLPPDARARLEQPQEVAFAFDIDGTGSIATPDRLHMRGTVTPSVADAPASDFELVVIGAEAWMRAPDGTWLKVPGPTGPFSLVLDADAMGTMMLSAAAGVEVVGVEDLDGVSVRHYRATLDTSAAPSPPPGAQLTSVMDAWIGVDDGLLRTMTVVQDGRISADTSALSGGLTQGTFESTYKATQTLRLSDFGAEVSIEAPPADQVKDAPAPAGSAAYVYPFGAHVSASFGTND